MSRIRRTDLAFSTLNSTSRVSPDTRTKWAATVAEERANTNARSPPNLPTQSSQSSLVSPDTRIESASVSIERAGPNAGRFHLPTQWSQAWSVDVEAGLRTMLRTSARQEIVLRLRGERAEIMVSIMQLVRHDIHLPLWVFHLNPSFLPVARPFPRNQRISTICSHTST
jgi:hypothetical protein